MISFFENNLLGWDLKRETTQKSRSAATESLQEKNKSRDSKLYETIKTKKELPSQRNANLHIKPEKERISKHPRKLENQKRKLKSKPNRTGKFGTDQGGFTKDHLLRIWEK